MIEVAGLSKSYGSKTDALVSTSFSVEENECYSLLGENGAGKTTTFKILTREEDKSGGLVQLLNLDADKFRTKISKEMGYCPQDDILFDLLTVEEHIEFYAKLRCLDQYEAHVDSLIISLSL